MQIIDYGKFLGFMFILGLFAIGLDSCMNSY